MNPVRLRLTLGLAVLTASLAGCGKPDPATAPTPELPPPQVQLAPVRAQTAPALIETTGTVRPIQRAVLAAKVMGAIEELPVTLGQSVRAGEVLIKISAGEISARLLQAQSQLNVARRDLDRERELLTKGASTADTVNGLEDRLALNEAMVREAEVMLGYATIRAPFDGVVARKLVNAGDLAAPGQPLLEVEGTGAFEIDADIPDSLASALAPGSTVLVTLPASNASFEGIIAELSSAADPVARSVGAKITVPPTATVRSGQFARVQVPGAPTRVLLVPAEAVSPFGQLERIFVAANGRAQLRLVKTGARRGAAIEIASGLDEGEQVVVAPPASLHDGQRVEAQP
jgi:RND family efflux transporter MFP subunit